MRIIEHGRLRTYPILLTEAREFRNENAGQIRNILLLLLLSSSSSSSFSSSSSSTLVPGAIYGGSEERSESPLVESVGNLTSMLSQPEAIRSAPLSLYKLPLEPGYQTSKNSSKNKITLGDAIRPSQLGIV